MSKEYIVAVSTRPEPESVGTMTLETTSTLGAAGIAATDIATTPDVNLTWINSTGLSGFDDNQW